MAKCSLLLYEGTPGVCVRCGRPLKGRQRRWCGPDCERAWQRNHVWPIAREAALQRDERKCVKCGSTDRLEVNHIEPRNGQGYDFGCHHHLSGIESLCHTCHVIETGLQRAQRQQAKQAADR